MDGPYGSTSASPLPVFTSDPYRPSFFELIAQDQLRDLLRPAVRYTLSVLAQRRPRYLLRIFNNFDELWALVMLAVERHYLKTWGSSFAENFYMLRRRKRPGLNSSRLPPSKHSEKLTAWKVNASLFFIVGLPYIQAKAHDWWERNGGGVDNDLFDDDANEGEEDQRAVSNFISERENVWSAGTGPTIIASQVRRAISWIHTLCLKAYPYAAFFWQLWILSYNARYLFGKSHYWRPWLTWLNLEIRRVGPGDYPASIPLLPPDLPSPFNRPREFTARLLRSGPYMTFESLRYLLPASIFFLKFLEWWYSGENPRRRNVNGDGGESGGPRFGAPKILLPSKRGTIYRREPNYKDPQVALELIDEAAQYQNAEEEPNLSGHRESGILLHNSCPVCGAMPIKNPAVLPTGYAMCYICANSYVEEHGRCPVTQLALRDGVEGVRRVLG